MLGTHWTAWAGGCPPERLDDEAALQRFLERLPLQVGLTPVAPPLIRRQPQGLVGVVLLAESHASVHLMPAEGVLFADLFSCVAFDRAVAVALLRETWAPTELREQVLERGPAAGLEAS